MLGPITGRLFGAVAALAAAFGVAAYITHAGAAGEERTISFFHIHTEERLTITYKRDGQYIPEALEKINWIMRDWRQNKAIAIDPHTIDIIWEMHEELGSKEPVNIICGYRSSETNEMLRRTVGGQAKQSQHISGKAVDFMFPDIPLRQMRYSALVRERGGVGYYPGSGIPFIHVDSGRVRHWPPMPSSELALLFPNGHSKHDPSLTAADAKRAAARNKETAAQVAQYFEIRNRPKTSTLVADAGDVAAPAAPKPTPAVRPAPAAPVAPEYRMGVGAPTPAPEDVLQASAPQLVTAPRVAERPAVARTDDGDRSRLDALVRLASLDGPSAATLPAATIAPPPVVTSPREPVLREPVLRETVAEAKPAKPKLMMASLDPMAVSPLGLGAATSERKAEPQPATLAALDPAAKGEPKSDPAPAALAALDAAATSDQPIPRLPALVNAEAAAAGAHRSEAIADDFDDEHPEELFYRAFSLAPLLTSSASADEPALAALVHPDATHAFDVLDDDGSVEHVSLRRGTEIAGPTPIPAFQAVATAVAGAPIRTSSR